MTYVNTKTYTLSFNGYFRKPAIDSLPAKSGIYGVYRCTFNAQAKTVSLKELLYIGEADDINDRVTSHERWPDWEAKLKAGEVICFTASLISPQADRERAEAAMINHYKPACNKEYVNNFPFGTTTVSIKGAWAEKKKEFTVF